MLLLSTILAALGLLSSAPAPSRAFAIPDPIVHFGIGAVAGGCGAIAYQPFDYIKAQLQSSSNSRGRSSESHAADAAAYKNGWDCLVKTLQSNPMNLYQGVTVAVTGVAPEKSIKLGVNDIMRQWFASQLMLTSLVAGTATSAGTILPLWCQVASGAIAGACQVIVSSPLDVIKVRLQTESKVHSDEDSSERRKSKNQLARVFKEVTQGPEGYGGLYRGVEACLIRDISFTAVCFPLYASLVASGSDPFVAGALSGVVSTLIATPADMVKTRILSSTTATSFSSVPSALHGEAAVSSSLALAQSSSTSDVMIQSDGSTVLSPTAAVATSATTQFRNGTETWPPSVALQLQQTSPRRSPTSPAATTTNPVLVARSIMQQEGPAVLLSGVYERCIGAVPRFGITLGVHEWLEHYASHVGLLSS